jgi:hypothetical protein
MIMTTLKGYTIACLMTHYDSLYAYAVCLSATVLKSNAITGKKLAVLLRVRCCVK